MVGLTGSPESRIFFGFNGSLTVGVLPVAQFSGGHTYFVQKLYEVGAGEGLRAYPEVCGRLRV